MCCLLRFLLEGMQDDNRAPDRHQVDHLGGIVALLDFTKLEPCLGACSFWKVPEPGQAVAEECCRSYKLDVSERIHAGKLVVRQTNGHWWRVPCRLFVHGATAFVEIASPAPKTGFFGFPMPVVPGQANSPTVSGQ